ncbi:hypothetical protein BHE74_00048402 [Ensete ventricosum]|uniref:Uncharacterized protein n=1 Tax=Ensete ventricosum TaxID=4639 RepID=A0A426ZE16_ENSVE|nr:hypothetical protein B296_00041839 [Ensete ventricosum]RWW45736.1 hypothetical protein BHE74_00048402 [Ensete ventricosum]
MACSAVFGTEMWPAAEYGRTMYTIRQRIGPLLMKLQKRDGEFPNLSHATPAMLKCPRKMQNYLRKKEQKERRQNDLREGLKLYRFVSDVVLCLSMCLMLQTIRNDPDLANLRASEEFEPLMKKFDESFINENAINAIKSLFGIFNKD